MGCRRPSPLSSSAEVSERLVGSPAFKAGGMGDPCPAGSIPVHLRHSPTVSRMTRALQPDVAAVLDYAASLELPALESLAPVDARAFQVATAANRPPGPEVGEMVDGELPGAAGPLAYRLYRPVTPGPHPLTAYFHGGGFVIGSQISDDPFCRQLCIESDSIIVSVDYRHAPEHRFPAAHDDGFAAARWLSANRESLGASPAPIAVSGWSAGGNIAATITLRQCRGLRPDHLDARLVRRQLHRRG